MKPRIAIFASGNGSNFEALARATAEGAVNAETVLCITDRPGAYVVERAKKLGIQAAEFCPKNYDSKADYEKAVLETLRAHNVDFICLAGYMRLIGNVLLEAYRNRMINIHPSLLPAFKGAHAIQDAFEYGVKVTGVTVHYVDETLDGGKIIAQIPVETDGDSLETLESKIHACEHILFPKALQTALDKMK